MILEDLPNAAYEEKIYLGGAKDILFGLLEKFANHDMNSISHAIGTINNEIDDIKKHLNGE